MYLNGFLGKQVVHLNWFINCLTTENWWINKWNRNETGKFHPDALEKAKECVNNAINLTANLGKFLNSDFFLLLI